MMEQNLQQQILSLVPHKEPFRFVEEILEVDAESITGTYTYKPGEYFYQGHFPDNPVTPGVILTETMAQIGLVGLGAYLQIANSELKTPLAIAFTSSEVEFLKMVRPGDKVIVYAQKIYFRLNKLKCKVEMRFPDGERICYGTMAGMIIKQNR